MGAWTEYNGYWYEIQKRGEFIMVYVYDALQKKVFACACDPRDDAQTEAEDWIDNEAD